MIKNYKKKYNENGELIESSFTLDVGNILLNSAIRTTKEFLDKHESELSEESKKELSKILAELIMDKMSEAPKVKQDFCNVKREKKTGNQVQLAHNLSEEIFDKPYYSRKFDGKRMYVLDGKPYTRNNKECTIPPIEHITNELSTLEFINDFVLDGECLYFDKNGKEDFKKVVSLTSRTERSKNCAK